MFWLLSVFYRIWYWWCCIIYGSYRVFFRWLNLLSWSNKLIWFFVLNLCKSVFIYFLMVCLVILCFFVIFLLFNLFKMLFNIFFLWFVKLFRVGNICLDCRLIVILDVVIKSNLLGNYIFLVFIIFVIEDKRDWVFNVW